MQDRNTSFLGIGRRIVKIRKAQGLTQDAFAQKYGVSRNSQLEYEKERTLPSGDYLGRLAADGYDINEILTGQALANDQGGFCVREEIRIAREDAEGFVSVPRYNVKVAAGSGAETQSEQIVNYFKFSRVWLSKRGLDPMHITMVEVLGDSMEPVLSDGDVVLVDHSDTSVKSGRAYVLRIGSDLLVKYLERLPDNKIKVSSENAQYTPYEIDAEQFDGNLSVIGRVVASSHNW